ncbi:MAG: methionyl-tRNA formyltransferase [Pseudomonadales bacterium]
MSPTSTSSATTLRQGFAGTPAFAARILEALIDSGRAPVVVYTQPDRPVGRGRKVQSSAVKQLASNHGLPVEQPQTLRTPEAVQTLADWDLDVLVVAAYGLILPPPILALPRLGCLNVHASLLPRWRGAAPVERAIMAGDAETGVCIMAMEQGLDTGPVYACRRTAITSDDDGQTLETRLAGLGAAALMDCLEQLPALTPAPQPTDGVSYAHKLTAADARIDWERPAAAIVRQVRALRGRMPAVTHAGATRVAIIDAAAEPGVARSTQPGTVLSADPDAIRIACGDGVLAIKRLRLNIGKGRALSAAEALNGYARLFQPNERLGEQAQ